MLTQGGCFMNNKEIEIKVCVDESNYFRLVDTLKRDANFRAEKHQIDIYYSPQNESFYDDGDRCLRVRTEEGKSLLSYKRIYGEHTDQRYIEEYETHIESYEVMDKILRALHYRSEIKVDKYRIEYSTDTGFLIALDKVVDLGYFVEIENQNEFDELEKRNRDLIDYICQLGLDISKRNKEGYSNMIFRKNHSLE